MTEVGKALREGFAQALDGNLTYSSTNVPVFDQKVEGSSLMYVVLAKMTENNQSNKSRFVSEKSLDVEIYNVRKATSQSGVLDDIANQILGIIVPTLKTIGFTVSGHSVTFCRLENSVTENPTLTNGDVVQLKRLTFKTRIVQ